MMPGEPTMLPRDPFSRAVLRAVLIVLSVLGILWLIWLLRRPLIWIVLAAFLAVAVSAPINRLSRHMRRGAAIAVTYVALFLVPVGILAVLLPSVISAADDLVKQVPTYVDQATKTINDNRKLRQINQDYGITKELQNQAAKLPSKIGTAAGTLTSIGIGIVNGIFAAVTILILSVFMASNGRRWVKAAVERAPPDRQERLRRTLDRIGSAIGSYVGGVLLQATIAGITTFIVLKILGVPFAGALAILMALLDMLPLVGATIGAALIALVTLFHDFPTVTIIWVVWAIIYQQLENSVIQPRIQSRALNVHPFVVLVSVLFGSTLFGVGGALLAIPIAAALQIALHEWLDYRRDLKVQGMVEPPVASSPP
jgi:predicted PurR-regulated permease PerM